MAAPERRAYYYKPASSSVAKDTQFPSSSTTFVLDKDALELPVKSQQLLKRRGWFQSISGVLYSHRDPRVPVAPLWVRLLAPTRTLVYTAQLAWLFARFRLFLLPLLMLSVLGLDPVMKEAENLDGENAGGSSAHYAFVLSTAALSSDWLNFAINHESSQRLVEHVAPVDSSSGAGWLQAIFPVAESWTQLFCWPVGAALGLVIIQFSFPYFSSSQWTSIWNIVGIAFVISYMMIVPGAYVWLTLCIVVSAVQHAGTDKSHGKHS